jgi:uncharacterized protein involved in exopolysaccharide biosynthesis
VEWPGMAEEGPWLSLTEAAQRSGLAREAIRAQTRRKLIPSQKGNRGELLVQLPADLLAGDVQGMAGPAADPVADLLAEVADLREQLARTEAEREAARAVATAEVAAAKTGAMAEVAAKEELIQELRKMLGSLRAELVEARRPWWRRFIGK